MRWSPVIILTLLAGSAFPAFAGSAEPHTLGFWDQFLTGELEIPVLWLMALFALATLISEDMTCVAAGLLTGQGVIGFRSAVLACFTGIFVGDILLFLLGRFLGHSTKQSRFLRWIISAESLTASTRWFERRGPMVILLSRFVPGSRFPTYVAAGFMRMSLGRFLIYFAIAAAIWTPVLVWIAEKVGQPAIAYLRRYELVAVWVLVLALLATWIAIKIIVPLTTFAGRHLLAGRLKRMIRWEFWPPWFFYAPLLLYICRLAIRHRSPTVFTAVNPGIEDGGFIGESKAGILDLFKQAQDIIPAYCLLNYGTTGQPLLEQFEAFMQASALQYPVVLKPDQGQRGQGVAVIQGPEEAATYLSQAQRDIIAQAYVPGEEFGIFYFRYPDEPAGQIFSITEKQLPTITGDGKHTVEHLILKDRRHVCYARQFLLHCNDRRYDVPDENERLQLSDLGTHCRGALFLDAADCITPPLLETLNQVLDQQNSFSFGRLDVRVPDREALKNGRQLQLIEINGVTSEATHIYDPRHSLIYAYRVLACQWRMAYEIGAVHRRRGAVVTPASTLLRKLLSFEPMKGSP